MCLGLCNAPSTFSRLMNLVLHGLTYVYCLVYLDDTIIYSMNFEDHLKHINEILDRLIKAKLKLNPNKCVFAADEVQYLGYIVTTEGIKPDPDKIKAINEIKFPKNPKEMIRFLGGVNFYRDFIKKFSFTASILYKMSQSIQKFKAKLKCKEVYEAFDILKTTLMSEPILCYPNFKLPFVIQTDASSVAIGGVIGQVTDSKFKPIKYCSRHLTATESRYSTTERELLAVVWSYKRCKEYVYGRHVSFVVDHEPLVTMKKLKEPMGRIGNLLLKLQDCDYDIYYQPGALNFIPDLLSRPSVDVITEVNNTEIQFDSCVNWIAEQNVDDQCVQLKKILNNISEGTMKDIQTWQDLAKPAEWFKVRTNLLLENGILLFNDSNTRKIVVPKQVISLVLNFCHDIPLAGHRDFEKTFETISKRFFWLCMHRDIKNYCASCHLCQTKKYLNKVNKAPLKPIVVREAWSLIGIDTVGAFKVTIRGNRYILMAVDYFTKFCVARAVKDFTAASTALFLFEDIVCKFGLPKGIMSDKGVNFKSNMLDQLCKLLSIKKANSTFYHAEGNGMVERTVKSVKQIVTMYVNVEHSNWDEFLQPSISAYNTTVHSSLKLSPYEALFAKSPTILAEVMLAVPVDTNQNEITQYVKDLKRNASEINRKVNNNLDLAREKQKKYYDQSVKANRNFTIGDNVLLINERDKTGESKAFKERALGPFKVLNTFNNDLDYTVQNVKDKKVQTAHYNRLIPYRLREAAIEPTSHAMENQCKPNKQQILMDEEEFFSNYLFMQNFLLLQETTRQELLEEITRQEQNVQVALYYEYETGEEIFAPSRYQCKQCTKSYASERKLLNHVSKGHITPTFNIETGVRSDGKVKCIVCENFYEAKRGIKIHMKRKHVDYVPIVIGVDVGASLSVEEIVNTSKLE